MKLSHLVFIFALLGISTHSFANSAFNLGLGMSYYKNDHDDDDYYHDGYYPGYPGSCGIVACSGWPIYNPPVVMPMPIIPFPIFSQPIINPLPFPFPLPPIAGMPGGIPGQNPGRLPRVPSSRPGPYFLNAPQQTGVNGPLALNSRGPGLPASQDPLLNPNLIAQNNSAAPLMGPPTTGTQGPVLNPRSTTTNTSGITIPKPSTATQPTLHK